MGGAMAEVRQTDPDSQSSAFLEVPPLYFSLAYHFHFLPRVIAWRLAERRGQQHGFGFQAHVEIPLAIFACLLLIAFGLPPALQHSSVGGWLSTLIGVGALVALFAWSIVGEWRWRREEGHRYGYAEFMPSVFFFCVLAGASVGLIAGDVVGNDPVMGYLWAVPGLLAGYLAGLFAARWVHGLGFIKIWFIYLAVLGLILLPFEDLMVLYIYSRK